MEPGAVESQDYQDHSRLPAPSEIPQAQKGPQWEDAVERPAYDLTIFKLHCGNLTPKIYTKGERVLRIEAMAHDVAELDYGRSLEKFPEIVLALKSMPERFMNDAPSCIDPCFIADFTVSELAQQVRTLSQQSEPDYGPLRAAYYLKKLRGKQLVRPTGETAKYEPIPAGLRAMAALLLLRNKAIKSLLAAAQELRPRLATAHKIQGPSTSTTKLSIAACGAASSRNQE